MSAEPFIYLLNRMEVAAHSINPSEADFAKHRQAVIDRVTAIESARDELVRALQCWMKYFGADHATAVLAIVEDGSTLDEAQELTRAALANAGKEGA